MASDQKPTQAATMARWRNAFFRPRWSHFDFFIGGPVIGGAVLHILRAWLAQ